MPGDRLLVYSDGMVETRDPSNREFGADRLRESFLKTNDRPLTEAIEELFATISGHAADRPLDPAEIAAEVDLLLVGHRLIVEDQYRVPVHALLDCRDVFWGQRLADVNSIDLSDEDRVDLTNRNAHVGVLPGRQIWSEAAVF